MIPTMCWVHSGQISDAMEASLREQMNAFSERVFGTAAGILWVTVPEKSGFTAAEPSTSVLVQMRSNRALEKPERVDMLNELCDMWMKATGKSMNEVITVIADPE